LEQNLKRLFSANNHVWVRYSRLLVRKTKRLIEFVAYGLFDSLVLSVRRRQKNSKSIAIVHLELLGDYVLWMPYGRAMVRHFQLSGHDVVLVLNAAVLPLARCHFTGCTFIGIDRSAFVRNLAIRAKCLSQLRGIGARQVYHGTYPRDGIVEDAAVRALGGVAWGFEAAMVDRPWLDRWLSRKIYHCLLPSSPYIHQSRRHHAFLHFLNMGHDAVEVVTDFAGGLATPEIQPYFIVAPGASRSEKCWPFESFVAIAKRIIDSNPDLCCVVVGMCNEIEFGEALISILGTRVRSLAGKTDLIELTAWVAHAKLVIGNDSAVGHIAAACAVPSIVIAGGGHYGQFFPYDANAAHVQYLPLTISKKMECFGCDWVCRYRVEKDAAYPCIEAITPEQVYAEVEKLMQRSPAVMKSDMPDASLRKSS
jgi:hypothetical protein